MHNIVSVILIVFTFLTSPAFAADGVFMIVKGDVKVISKSKMSSAKVGMKVTEGDTVTTGPESRAKIVMSDKNVLNISPNSKVLIEIYKNNSATGEKKVELKVDHGKVRATVEQKYDDEENTFKIKTPTAVAGVRGTDFSVSFDPISKLSKVITFKGAVAVASSTLSGNNGSLAPILIRAGESTDIDPVSGPSAPIKLPSNELEKLDQESDASKATGLLDNAINLNDNNTSANTNEPQSANSSLEPKVKKGASPKNDAGREPSSNNSRSNSGNSMINSSDIAPDSASKLVEQSGSFRVPSSQVTKPPIPQTNIQQTTQNVITETVRNQITKGKSKVRIEINR